MVRKVKTFTVDNSDEAKQKNGKGEDGARFRRGGKGHGVRRLSRWTAAKTLASLIPLQISDEIELAKKEFKERGKIIGSSAVFFAVALGAALSLPAAITVLIISLLGVVLPLWLATVVVIAVFLVIAAIFAAVGLKKFKKAFPATPELLLRGITLDSGTIKEGSNFSEGEYSQKQEQKRIARERKKNDRKNSSDYNGDSPEPEAPLTCEELVTRLDARRDHMRVLRDRLSGGHRRRKAKRPGAPEAPVIDFPGDPGSYDDSCNHDLFDEEDLEPPELQEDGERLPMIPDAVEEKNKEALFRDGKVPLVVFLMSGLLSVLAFSFVAIKKTRRKNG